MQTARLVRKSGFTQRELAALLDMDEFQFSKKLHGWRGNRFNEDQQQTLIANGVALYELPHYRPESIPSPEAVEA